MGKKILFYSFIVACGIILLYRYDKAKEGEIPIDSPRSQHISAVLNSSLAQNKSIHLSSVLSGRDIDKTYIVLWPSYRSPNIIKCGVFPSGTLEELKVKYPLKEGVSMIISFDKNGIIDAATINTTKMVFCAEPQSNCVPYEKAFLEFTTTKYGDCYTLK